MNDEQYKRYRKLQETPVELLYHTRNKKGNFYFLVKGSRGDNYKISIYKENGKVACTCPDAQHGAPAQECVCKHCLHIIINVLKVIGLDHAFFKRRWFTADELQSVSECYRRLAGEQLL